MSITDVIKSSFLQGFSEMQLSTLQILFVLFVTGVIAVYIYFCYRMITRNTFYSKNFNISLVAIALITAAIILTIQASFVVSLGMVGALSIIRFRTAIKDPMDLIFLFWSIAVGIICGAGLIEIALILSVAVTFVIVILNVIPASVPAKILVVNISKKSNQDEKIKEIIEKYASSYSEKTRRISNDNVNMVYELRVKDGAKIVDEIGSLSGLNTVSLLSHDGEVTY